VTVLLYAWQVNQRHRAGNDEAELEIVRGAA